MLLYDENRDDRQAAPEQVGERTSSAPQKRAGELACAPVSARLLDMLAEPACLLGPTWDIEYVNAPFAEALGYAGAEGAIEGQEARDVFFGHDLVRAAHRQPPVPVTGEGTPVAVRMADGSLVPMRARCLADGRGSFVLVLADPSHKAGSDLSQDRLLDDLRTSNMRLRGILALISANTLELSSFEEFTSKVTDALQGVFDASAVLLYLAEERGYRLQGASSGYERLGIDQRFVEAGRGVTSLVTHERRSMRLQLVPGLADGESTVMLDLDTNRRFRLRTPLARRCSSIVATPIFSYDRVMAVILVCWRDTHMADAETLPMLDTVADFLSIEFETAVTKFQQSRRVEFAQLVEELRGMARERGRMDGAFARQVARSLVEGVPAHVVEIVDNPWTQEVTARPLDQTFLHADPQLPGQSEDSDEGISGPLDDEDATCGPDEPGSATTACDSDESGSTAAASDWSACAASTAIAVAYRDGIGMPYTFDEIFQGQTSCPVNAGYKLGAWVARHTDFATGMALRLSPEVTEGESPQYGLLLLRGPRELPLDSMERDLIERVGDMLARTLADERERINDTHIAQALQSGMRNGTVDVPGITSASLYLSSTTSAVVGGDFFDLYKLPTGRVMALIGDVSGKGVEAAAMASLVKTAVAAHAWDKLDPGQICSSVNDLVCNFSRAESFASLLLVLVDTCAHTATYCSAGHPPAMLVRRPHTEDAELELLTDQSPVVGAIEGMRYTNGTFSYDVGDVLFMYTDGTTEARSPNGDFFGEDALREALLGACRLDISKVPEAVLGRVAIFAEGNLRDDIAMLALRFDEDDESVREQDDDSACDEAGL